MNIKTLAFMRDAANNHFISEVGKALYEQASATRNLEEFRRKHPGEQESWSAWVAIHEERVRELEESHAEVTAWLKEQGMP
jgi:hypothetical protein